MNCQFVWSRRGRPGGINSYLLSFPLCSVSAEVAARGGLHPRYLCSPRAGSDAHAGFALQLITLQLTMPVRDSSYILKNKRTRALLFRHRATSFSYVLFYQLPRVPGDALSTTRGCGREDHLCCASRVPGLRCLLPSKAAALLLPKCLLLHHHRFRRCRLRVAQHVPLRAAQVPPAGS